MKKIATFLFFLLLLHSADSQTAGSLDPAFADKGWTYADLPKDNYYYETGRQVLLQNDGSYMVVFSVNGNTALTHYFADGAIDNSFATNGFTEPLAVIPIKAAQQSDGKVVVAGATYNETTTLYDLTILRYQLNGSLDKTFGKDGMVTTSISSLNLSYAIALQSDGKIVVAGGLQDPTTGMSDFALARYNPDGSPDGSFGANGLQTTDFGNTDDVATALAIQNDGKVVAAGYIYDLTTVNADFALARYNTNGTLDRSFSGDGKATTDFGDHEYGYALAIQTDGKLVMAGAAWGYTSSDFALARYTANGSLDNSFDGDGKVTTDFFDTGDAAYALALQKDGKIVAAGATNYDDDFALVRYNENGSPDQSFDGDGKVITAFSGSDQATSLLIQNDGKIVALGNAAEYAQNYIDYALARYNSNGSPDNSFNGNGTLRGFLPIGYSKINAIAVQKDGKIVVAGSYYLPGDEDFEKTGFSLGRFNADGTPDSTFDGDGVVTTRLRINDNIYALALQGDGKIVVAGVTSNYDYNDADFALARYNPDGSLDNTFGQNGKVITDFGSDEEFAKALAIQNDGKIVVAGYTYVYYIGDDFALARYNPDGSLDNSFDGDGKLTTDFGNSDRASALAIQKDGKIVVAGSTTILSNNYTSDFALARYNANGSLDNSFGKAGKATADFGSNDYANALALQSDGKIIVAGYTQEEDGTKTDFALVRCNPDGTLDNTFDGDGKMTTDFSGSEGASSVAIQNNGKIIAAGSTVDPNNYTSDFALVRYNTDGSLDHSFSDDGKLLTGFGGNDQPTSTAIYNNRLYVAGFTSGETTRGIIAAYQLGCNEQVFYKDQDKDGYGDRTQKVAACSAPAGYVPDSTDCNDSNAAVHPGAKEICGNHLDDNCDGQIDEGCPGKPLININDVTVYEAQGKATLTVTLSKKSSENVTVSYRTGNGTAKGTKEKPKNNPRKNQDYLITSGSLTFAPGEQAKTISIIILNDGITEGDEYFEVELEHASGATIDEDDGRVTIKDGAAPAMSSNITKSASPQQLNIREEKVSALLIKAMPNPSTNYFTVLLQGSGNSAVTISVLDELGRLVESRTGVVPNATLQIGQNYRPGVYYVQVVQGSESTVLKLLKQGY